MSILDGVIVGILLLWLAAVCLFLKKKKKSGGCIGCSGCSGNCGSCSANKM